MCQERMLLLLLKLGNTDRGASRRRVRPAGRQDSLKAPSVLKSRGPDSDEERQRCGQSVESCVGSRLCAKSGSR